jgi:predicted CXXCH cytochrome family protein
MNQKYLVTFIILSLLVICAALAVKFTLFPAPAAKQFPEVTTLLDQFVAEGKEHTKPENCVKCHQEQVEAWQNSHHALANAPLDEEDRQRLALKEDPLLVERDIHWHDRPDTVVLNEEGVPDQPIVGTIGLTPLVQYLHMAADGRIQTHDVAWDTINEEWFSVFEMDDAGQELRKPGEWGHWTGQGMNWDANCAYCHMTEFEKKYDPDTNTYHREWAHMAITCAQCHPDQKVHLSQIRNGLEDFEETLTKTQMMEYCATCHARRDQLTADRFVAGDDFEDHFSLTLMDMDGVYHPDGQVIGENYVYGSLTMSKMGHSGVYCMDCHDPHTLDFVLPWENNALCQRCHGSGENDAPKIDPIAHSRHKPESTGNQCVECHMPLTSFMGRDPRRDHSFSHPDPLLTKEMDIPNVCVGCHQKEGINADLDWNLQYAHEWYGEDMNADRRKKARLMRDLFDGVEGAGDRLKVAVVEEENRMWKATFTSMFQYVPSDQEIFAILLELVKDPEPMVRAAAIRLIGTANLPEEDREELLNDPIRMVRIAAALSTPQMQGISPELEKELLEYIRHTADSPMGSLRLSSFLMSRGDLQASRKMAKQAVTFEPLNVEAHRLAAVQLHASGDSEAAFKSLEVGLKLEPGNPLLHFNMGLLHAELNNMDNAVKHLNAAVTSDNQFEDAWYNLIVLYWQMGQMPTARAKLSAALTAIPTSRRLQQLAAQMPPAG